ncbi:hypothetical protein FRC03_010717 [Tulasnella sp. 419]|nr:hypothetical protein FRC03_010717 [Tulasnella sp. 419]
MTSLSEIAMQESVHVVTKHASLVSNGTFSLWRFSDTVNLGRLDTEIDVLESVLALIPTSITDRLLRTRQNRNQLTPIYWLHPELLSNIFAMIQEYVAYEVHRNVHEPTRQVASVSSYWRSINLSTPRLWTFIHGSTYEGVIESALKKSKNCALMIHMSSFDFRRWVVDTILPHVDRWKELCISNMWSHRSQHPESIESVDSTPQLEVFEVDHNYLGLEVPGFVANGAPKLRHLSIKPFALILGAPVFRGLRTLMFTPMIAGSALSSLQWKELLRSSPNIEHLIAVGFGGKEQEQPFHSFRVGHPRLQTLCLTSIPASTVGALISSICVEPQTYPTVEIKSPCGIEDNKDDIIVLKNLPPATSQPQSLLSLIRSMKWMCADSRYLDYTITAGGDLARCYLKLEISIHKSIHPQTIPALWAELGLGTGFSKLESVKLEGHFYFSYDSLFHGLSSLVNLRKLELS